MTRLQLLSSALLFSAAALASAAQLPSAGMSMGAVERSFGKPQQKLPAVGHPPISRWVYDSYTVYFERNNVIHSVLTETSTTPVRPAGKPTPSPAPAVESTQPEADPASIRFAPTVEEEAIQERARQVQEQAEAQAREAAEEEQRAQAAVRASETAPTPQEAEQEKPTTDQAATTAAQEAAEREAQAKAAAEAAAAKAKAEAEPEYTFDPVTGRIIIKGSTAP